MKKKKKLKGKKIEVVHEDGTVSYIYKYKRPRKIGRPKKRGPKKKKPQKPTVIRTPKPWDFKILRCEFKKEAKHIGKYHDIEEVTKKKLELLEENKKVVIPVKFHTNKRKSTAQYEYEGEYIVLKHISDTETQSNESQLRNEYGKYVKHKTTSEDWLIYDKFPYVKEETFWVFGMDPKSERKTAEWIGDNLIELYLEDSLNLIQIYLYGNKLVFRYDSDTIELVMTKNVTDAIRLYNYLEQRFIKLKKRILFMGYVKSATPKGSDIFSLIKQLTNWTDDRIYRKRTY